MEESTKKPINKKLIIILAVAVILIAAVIIIFFVRKSGLTAITMRILRIEGTVSLEENGKEKPVKENLRLNEGNALNTATASIASVGLDEYKIVTLNEESRAEFNKLGKKLDLSLTEGSMYVDVQKKLEDNESFDVHTSSMVVGIRGTSLLIENKDGIERITVTDGIVHITGTNHVTGETKEIDVPAGKTIVVYLYNDREVDSIMFELTDANYADLPGFVKDYLKDHPETVERIVEGTSWKAEDLTGSSGEGTPAMTETGEGEAATDGTGEDTGEEGADGEATETGDAAEGAEAEEPAAEAGTVDGNNASGETTLTSEQIEEARGAIVFTNTENGILLLSDGTLFDPAFYAMSNPEVVAMYGSSTEALVWHYLHRGKAEGRPPMAPVVTAKEPEIPHFDPNADQTSSSSDDDDDDDDEEESQTPDPHATDTVTVDANTGKMSGSNITGDVYLENGTIRTNGGNIILPVTYNGTTYNDVSAIAIGQNGGTASITYGSSTNVTHSSDGFSCTGVTVVGLNNPYDNYTDNGDGTITLTKTNAQAAPVSATINKNTGAVTVP